MAGEQILPTVPNSAIPVGQPIQVDAPLATQKAVGSFRPSEVNYQQATDDFRESSALVSQVKEANLRAMSAFSAGISDKVAKMQEESFAEGYFRHMQGESVATIAEDNPFKVIFGDGAAVRGARQAQLENSGNSILTWVQANQGDLATMPADQQRKAVADYVETLNTGDPQADQMIAMQAMRMFPAVMDNLTRTSEAENQRQAAVAQADVMEQHAQGLQYAADQVAKGQLAPEYYDNLKAQAIQAAMPLPGQSPEAYRTAAQGNILSLIRNGQFELANDIKTQALDPQLSPDERFEVEQQMKQAQAQWLVNNPVSADYTVFTGTLPSQIAAGRYSSAEALAADIDHKNLEYKAQTGAITPLINNEDKAAYINRWSTWQQQEAANQATAAGKAQDEQVKRTIWLQGFAGGSPATMTASGLDARQKAAYEQAEATKFLTEPGLQSASNLGKLAVNGYTVAPLKEKLTGTLGLLKGGGVPRQEDMQAVQQSYQKFLNTPYGAGAAEAYFGDDLPLVMEMAGMDLNDKSNQQYIREKAQAGRTRITPNQEAIAAANDLVDSELKPGWWSRTFGDAQAIGVGYEAVLKDEMKKHTAEVMAQMPNLDQDQVLKIASQRSMKGKQVLGNTLVAGPGADKLFSQINSALDIPMQTPGDTRFNVALNDTVRAKVDKRYNFTVGSVNAFQNGQIYMTVTRDDGTQQNIVTSAADIATRVNSNKVKQTQFNKDVRSGLTYDAYGTNPTGRNAAYNK